MPAKLPTMLAGMPMAAVARAMAAGAWPSERPGGRLNESVAATNAPWWFTPSGVWPGSKWLNAASGTMVSCAVLTEAPLEAPLLPDAASALLLAFRAESCATLAAVSDVSDDCTVPAGNPLVLVPGALAPEVLIQMSRNVCALCQ